MFDPSARRSPRLIILQEAARFCACASWLAMHRIVLERGIVIGRRSISTDVLVSIITGATSTIWFIASASASWTTPGITRLEFLASFSQSPLIVQTLFMFWAASFMDSLRCDRVLGSRSLCWSLISLNGPFDWASGLHRGFYLAMCFAVSALISITAFASVSTGDSTYGVLNTVGLLVFLLNGVPGNPYVHAPHRYSDKCLRIALPTDHHEGTVYILPRAGHGIRAVWSPKIVNEHLEADGQIMALYRNMRSRRWSLAEPLQRMRATLAAYQQRVVVSAAQVACLAHLIYIDETPDPAWDDQTRQIRCMRAPGVHLIGRDLMFALCHAEYLVFMGQAKLSRRLRDKLGLLRLMSRSGADQSSSTPLRTVGYQPGLVGYREAAVHVYKIFNEEVDEMALNFDGTLPPTYSDALSRAPTSIEDYVASLWDICCEHNESTFTALYMFTTVWFMELGNVNGFHPFPLRCWTRDGDRVSQQIVWRQVWYSGIIAQLIAVSPAIFMTFVVGLLR